jgi:hypothetical protein
MTKRKAQTRAAICKQLIAAGDKLSAVREDLDFQVQSGKAGAAAVDQIDVLDYVLDSVDSLIADFSDEEGA